MTEEARLLQAGDIVWVDFDPVRGTEQNGMRPALVLSSEMFHRESVRAIVCPITRNMTPWPTKVFLPEGMETHGCVLTDQIRALHRAHRGFRFIERAPEAVLQEVRAILAALLQIA